MFYRYFYRYLTVNRSSRNFSASSIRPAPNIRINYLVLGLSFQDRPFISTVKQLSDDSVEDFLDTIKKRLGTDCPPGRLQGYRVDIPLSRGRMDPAFTPEESCTDETRMEHVLHLGDYFGGEFTMPNQKKVQVLVKLLELQVTIARAQTLEAAHPKGLPYRAPKDLLSTSGAQWDYQGSMVARVLGPAVTAHYNYYKQGLIDKQTIPLYIILAGAGMGKSRHANEFHRTVCSSLDLADPASKELSGRLKNAWVFHVNLENDTAIKSGERQNPAGAIAARMILQLLDGDMDESSIYARYSPGSLNPKTVLKLLARHHSSQQTTTLILVVDGMHNFIDPETQSCVHLEDALTDLGNFASTLSRKMFVLVCCTSLLIGQHSGKLRRTVAVMDALWRFYEEVNQQPAMSVSKLMNLIEISLKCKYESAFPDKFPAVQIVKAVLGHKRLAQQDFIPGTTTTVDEVCSTGLIRFIPINSDDSSPGMGFIDAPYIWLWVLFKNSLLFHNLQLDDYARYEGNPTSPSEQLKSTMYNNGEEVAIGEMHYGARMSEGVPDIAFKNHHLKCIQLVKQTDTRTTNDNMKQWVVKAAWEATPSSEIDLRTCDYIARNAVSAPYGDAFLCLDRFGIVYCNESPMEAHHP
ncbi:hypothetical protein L211DRAFT_870799 [Terfezia boudieri ATCC MYA-4762]|uniref:Uncharacterized protein n=1 Tax=Terfezia boudieri ATCC MYA-4762 TaxID=1051890 RepID=A0A3N4LBK8_9PEZI|nr:hypothetical protein L211DRAFT_870799 [Terfezia boudieri ATCC MYA-4762]